jgi:hypothetical protein
MEQAMGQRATEDRAAAPPIGVGDWLVALSYALLVMQVLLASAAAIFGHSVDAALGGAVPHLPWVIWYGLIVAGGYATWSTFSRLRVYRKRNRTLTLPEDDFVLYLRPFSADIGVTRYWFHVFARGVTSSLLRPPPPLEAQIAEGLWNLGPLLALDRPLVRSLPIDDYGEPIAHGTAAASAAHS